MTMIGDGGVTLTCSDGAVTFDVLLTATVGATKLKAVRTVTVYYTAPSLARPDVSRGAGKGGPHLARK